MKVGTRYMPMGAEKNQWTLEILTDIQDHRKLYALYLLFVK